MLTRRLATIGLMTTLLGAAAAWGQSNQPWNNPPAATPPASQPPSNQPRATPADIQRLGEFILTPGHLTAVAAAITAFEPTALAASCKDVKPVKGRSWQPIEDPVFERFSKAPTNALWQESWEVNVCGTPGVRNLGFVARPGQGVVPLPMFPGDSLADLTLQVAAGQMALDTVAPGTLGCGEGKIQVINSTVTNRATFARGQWSERWAVAGCGRTADIDVDFTPGPNGQPNYGFRAGKAR